MIIKIILNLKITIYYLAKKYYIILNNLKII